MAAHDQQCDAPTGRPLPHRGSTRLGGARPDEGAAAVAMRVAAQLDGTHPGDAGRAYVLLGEIFDRLGDVPRARQLYETGIGLLSRQGASRYLADAYRRLAELFEAEYRTEDAVAVLKRALAVQARVRPTLAVAAERPT